MDKKKSHPPVGDAEDTVQHEEETAAPEQASAGLGLDLKVLQLEQALAAKEAEAAANWDKFVRERADLENFRKRTQKEKEELLKYGNESLIQEILPVIDNMERALAHVSPEDAQQPLVEGIGMTYQMLLTALKKFGVVPMEIESGTAFDPALHHAVHQVESDELPPNSVAEVFQRGYLLNDRLLRAAMVVVAIAPKKPAEDNSEDN